MHITQQDLDALRHYQPKLKEEPSAISAATAIILRDSPTGTEFLLMQRAKHEADPWSGQMAFPGGKVEITDTSTKAAAIRETAEEVAIELIDEEYVGQLDDIYGRNISSKSVLNVSCFVFKTRRELTPRGNHEVADLVWLPLSYLNERGNAHEFYHPKDQTLRLSAVMIDQDKGQILWGLSLRMLDTLFKVWDKPMLAATDG